MPFPRNGPTHTEEPIVTHYLTLAVFIVATLTPVPDRDRDAAAAKKLKKEAPSVLLLESVELKSGPNGKTWDYDLTFNAKPTCAFAHQHSGGVLALVDLVEEAEPEPEFSVKSDGKTCLKMVVSAKTPPKKPLVQRIERVKDQKLLTYDVTFGDVPKKKDIMAMNDVFGTIMPRAAILHGKDPDKAWKFSITVEVTEGEKVVRYVYDATAQKVD